jgi:hypothetical protein
MNDNIASPAPQDEAGMTDKAALLQRFVAAILRHPARDLKAASRANRMFRLAGARRRSSSKTRV